MSELTSQLIVDGAVPSDPTLSPDGRWVAYTIASVRRKGEHPSGAIWIAAADGSSPPKQLTAGTAKDSGPRWAPDSTSLFFGSDRMKRGNTQLHRIALDGGEAEALTTWKSGISAYLPLAGGGLVAVVAADENEPDDVKVWGQQVPHGRLRLLDLDTGEFGVMDGLGDRHVAELAQRPDGGPLAVLTWNAPDLDPVSFSCELHVVHLDTGKVRHLGRTASEASSPTWWNTGDGWRVCYLGLPGEVGGNAVFDEEHRSLTAGMNLCPFDLKQVADGRPLALFADGLDTAIHRLDPDTRRFQRIASLTGWATSLTVNHSGEAVAMLMSTPYEPANVYAGPPGGRLIRLSDTRPELREFRWGTQERLAYQASDGLDLDGLLILPVGRSRQDGPFPLITLVHGGPYDRHPDRFMLNPHPSGQWLATAGYAVFLPNPRGSMGHGHDFAAAVAGAVGMEEWTDILSGIDLLIAEGVADPDRLGIGGWSHGGFMAAWAVGQTDRFKAALMGAGISDWGMLLASGDLGTLDAGFSGSCGWEGPGPHRHDRLSPISYASKIQTPVLILHGEEDTNVPLSQATYFHRALRWFGVEHEFVVYPREGHPILERDHQLDMLERTRAWFGRRLGDPLKRDESPDGTASAR
ncbi:S9 family peptidase [Streptosporangium minutum]|uniref:Dipeptidyl aminopeptidase n=1 Tax=Streptosporangium minutum TaxID=569862 RepID=A0A243R8K4_9ACTN|nr:prolyl oligopeptidase family serine peptidase [Streptosporangium minutum]OUC90879.1 dipeptidyl aminopeptidase [Streptosporangium minutum]